MTIVRSGTKVILDFELENAAKKQKSLKALDLII